MHIEGGNLSFVCDVSQLSFVFVKCGHFSSKDVLMGKQNDWALKF